MGGKNTKMCAACWEGDIGKVDRLLEKGANIESKNKNDQTPLHLATKKGNLAVVKLLLEKRANIESKDKYPFTSGY